MPDNFKKKKLLIIMGAIFLLSVILWIVSGAGIGVIRLHFGLMPNDVTHHLYMSNEELKETLPSEKYERRKIRSEETGN
jgi:hypothetical protein